jgi:hypothetical protein
MFVSDYWDGSKPFSSVNGSSGSKQADLLSGQPASSIKPVPRSVNIPGARRGYAILSGMKRLLVFFTLAALALAADITGNWTLDVETEMGSGSPTFTFKQDGEKLTGTYRGQLGEAPLTGKVTGDKVEFSFEISPTGEKWKVVYSGTVSADTMQGTIDFGGQATGTFKGKKQ